MKACPFKMHTDAYPHYRAHGAELYILAGAEPETLRDDSGTILSQENGGVDRILGNVSNTDSRWLTSHQAE
jgi:hypothetical protein